MVELRGPRLSSITLGHSAGSFLEFKRRPRSARFSGFAAFSTGVTVAPQFSFFGLVFFGRGETSRPPSAPEFHERRKHCRYPTRLPSGARVSNVELWPLVFSTLGGIGPEGAQALRRIKIAAPHGPSQRPVLERLALSVVKRVGSALCSAQWSGFVQ